jgi:hypothetical protein
MPAKGDTPRTAPLRTCCLNGNCFACVARHVDRKKREKQHQRKPTLSRQIATASTISLQVGWLAALVVLTQLGPLAPPQAWATVLLATIGSFLIAFIVAF